MAQTRFWNFQDDDSTFRMNHRDLLIAPYGLYSGFDAVLGSGLTLVLSHAADNRTKIKLDLSTSNPIGSWKTKQGVIVEEDASINILIAAGAGQPRIDLIVGRHKYIATAGGSAATYSVIAGTPSATPVAPALTYPDEQVILGVLYVPASMTNLNGAGVTYTKSSSPDFNSDAKIMKTDKVQTSTALKTFSAQKGQLVTATIDIVNKKIVLPSLSNYYKIEGVQSDFILIEDFELQFNSDTSVGAGWPITIYTDQLLKLKTSGSFVTRGLLVKTAPIFAGDTDFAMIESGCSVSFVDVTVGTPSPTNSVWLCTNHGTVLRGYHNKMNKMFIQGGNGYARNFETDGSFVWGGGGFGGFVSPTNYVEAGLNFAGVATDLISLQSLNIITKNTLSYEAGGRIVMRLTGNSGVACTLKHNAGSLSSGHKPFAIPTGADVLVREGTLIELVEDPTVWRVLNIVDAYHNSIDAVSLFAANRKKPYELLESNGVDVIGDGTNLGRVKTYTIAAGKFVNTGDVLKIKGVLSLTDAGFSGITGVYTFVIDSTTIFSTSIASGSNPLTMIEYDIEMVQLGSNNQLISCVLSYQTAPSGTTLAASTILKQLKKAVSFNFSSSRIIDFGVSGTIGGSYTPVTGHYLRAEVFRK